MRTLIILTSLLFVAGCAQDSGLVVVGSVYCETERPDGRAVAKVEVRYSPVSSDHDTRRMATAPKESDAAPTPIPAKPLATVADSLTHGGDTLDKNDFSHLLSSVARQEIMHN